MKFGMCKILVMLLLFFLVQDGNSQNLNPSFPRIGRLQMQRSTRKSNGALYKIISKYDLIVVSNSIYGPENYEVIRAENKDAIIFNTADKTARGLRDSDALQNSKGEIVQTHFAGNFPNFTRYNPSAANGAKVVAKYGLDRVDFPRYKWDGISWDNLNDAIWKNKIDDVDFDKNRVNDFDEHGFDWVKNRWRESMAVMLQAWRDEMNARRPNGLNIVFINSGNFLSTWHEQANGLIYEGWMRWTGTWTRFIEHYLTKKKDFVKPEIRLVDNYAGFDGSGPEKDNFALMRYGLTATLLGDGYYGFESGGEYHWSYWYDEFDVNLGYPKGPAQKVDISDGEVWVRYFDLGVVVCVPDIKEGGYPYTVNVPASVISGIYYHFRGGQNPKTNNGQPWNGKRVTIEEGNRNKRGIGDGFILLNEPKKVVSEIIVGNWLYHDTSPGSKQAVYTGDWDRKNSRETGSIATDNPYYGKLFYAGGSSDGTYRKKFNTYAYRVSDPNKGKAVHSPTINVPGKYLVYEWHGWHGDYPNDNAEATNLEYEVNHAGGKTRVAVNQQNNAGKWNLLGEFEFREGTSGNVIIDTQGANGYVISDVIRFVHGDTMTGDFTPPRAPENVKVGK